VSNSDSFIDEVTEELRRDRLFRLFRRYGWIAILAVVLIVGTAAFFEWRKARATGEARALGDALYAALDRETPQSRATALADITAEGPAAALRDFLASAQATEFDADAAGALLERIAADEAIRPIYRDLATLRLTMIPDYPMFSDAKLERLAPLTVPGAPLRLPAMEQMAYVHAERGETGQAIDLMRQIARDAEASQGQVQRANDLIVALGGQTDAAGTAAPPPSDAG